MNFFSIVLSNINHKVLKEGTKDTEKDEIKRTINGTL